MDWVTLYGLEKRHTAVIVKNRKVLAVAHNAVGHRGLGSGYSSRSIHAEKAVVKALGDISMMRGATLIVWRQNARGDVVNSKPCKECELFLHKCFKEYGLRKVIYSTL